MTAELDRAGKPDGDRLLQMLRGRGGGQEAFVEERKEQRLTDAHKTTSDLEGQDAKGKV